MEEKKHRNQVNEKVYKSKILRAKNESRQRDIKVALISFVCGVAITALNFGILWPTRLAKLSDGSDIIASVNGVSVSANNLYDEMNDRSGLSTLLDIVDKEILLNKYDSTEEAKEYAQSQAEEYYTQWESVYGYTKEETLSSNGFRSEQEFLDYLEIEYYKNLYFEEYLNSLVKEEDVKKYYDDVVKGQRRAYVFYTTEDSDNLAKVKKALEKGTDIEKLQDKYSDLTYRDLGNINFNSYNIYTEDFLKQVNKLEKNEVSPVFTDDNFGNVIVYVTDVQEKEAYDDIKGDIRNNLGQELYQNDQNVYYRAFQDLRNEYNFQIEDANLKDEYDDFVKETKEK